ncbi:hypothetical protein PWT90_06100 [Aphanocladium album]|nr:hypothetical protein PWT90_06100 [Aphanocladium album]
MAMELDWDRLNAIFKPRQDILDGIKRCAETPGKVALFNEIASHVHAKLADGGEPDAKRRKVQAGPATANGAANGGGGGGAAAAGNPADDEVLLCVKEISVSVPQRKKFELCLTQNFLYARAPGTTVPIQGMVYAWTDIDFAFYLPVPEKAQVQHNYILFPRGSTIPPKSGPAVEPLVFTVPATAPKEGTIGGSEAGTAAAVSDTYKGLFHWAFSRRLRAAGNTDVSIVSSDPSKFHSMVRQPHRPNEKAVHVGGFRGSKDGYLFFLENGILWGFKKPLIFIPLRRIAAVSYTNILQITFNIVVEVFPEEGGSGGGGGDGDANDEYEFGMVDQQDYGGIDDYVKRNGLQDRSMAEQRKGKLQLAENKAKKGADGEAADGAAGDGMTELERAALGEDLDDDEDEEDYDPGSDDGSDGSGESSDDDDDDDDDDDGPGEDDEDEEGEGEGEEEEEEEEGGEQGPGLSIR